MKSEIIKQHKATSNKKRHFCILLALLMIFGTIIPILPAMTVSAAEADAEKQSRIAEVREVLSAVPYTEYLKDKSDLYFKETGKLPYGSDTPIVIPLNSIPEHSIEDCKTINKIDDLMDILKKKYTDEEMQKDEVKKTIEEFNGLFDKGKTAIYLPDKGSVAFNFTVEKEGLYNLEFTYLQVVGKTSAIERMIKIDDKVPFKEARYITMTKIYTDDYKIDPETGESVFDRDIKENEIRPSKSEAPEWRTILTDDSSGFVSEPFLYYLTPGEHVLTLDAVRESVYIGEIRFVVAPSVPIYEEYLEQKKAQYGDKKGTADIKLIQAQMPAATSEVTIYPLNDRTSAITQPQDSSRIRLNSIGGGKWQMCGQWIRYEFDIPAGDSGWYYIVPRFKQAIYQGVYSSRKIRLDGEIPFQESAKLRFNFSDDWQVEPLNDGTVTGEGKNKTKKFFEFYLSEGHHVIEFEVALGDMAELLGQVEDSVMHLNEMYRKIRMITGATPDAYRDYGFERQIPAVLEGMWDEAQNLRNISAQLEEIIGSKGEHTVMLEKMALQLDKMAHNTDRIAPGMDNFKTNIGGMAEWLLERRNQPLEVDYIKIQPIDQKLPKPEANFFEAIAFEFSSFIMSFFADYNSQGAMEEITDKSKVVEVWLGSSAPVMGGLALAGRDQAQVLRQMIVSFTQNTNIQVNLKLVAGGSLLPSVLAGVGPDVSVGNWGGDAINFAIRSAVLPLNYDKEGNPVDYSKGSGDGKIKSFDEVRTFFTPSALTPLTLHDDTIEDQSKLQVFALPECQTFPMLFYRKDILVDLDLEVPTTWDELFDIVPVLQKKNYDVGILPGILPLYTFMFQQNVPIYKGDGIEINLDDNIALDSFKRMTKLYTEYKFPVEFNFANRFRSGDMPISVQYYDAYNQLTVFAPEIRGLWEFVPLPGTIREKTPEDEKWEAETGYLYDVVGESETGTKIISDNTSPGSIICTFMLRSSAAKENTSNAWAFMQWWVGSEAQGRFGSELVAMMGAAAKYPTANLEALGNMPWPTADYENLQEQFKHLEAVPEVPGGYIVQRYVDFAWKAVYNDGASAVEQIQDYLVDIDKELSRKRSEFNMSVIPRDKLGKKLVIDDISE
ncbi:MAG: extracellular solute-binding protein [Oscillospiraceae bacterium]|nr:extracellular solute-binding protein [Oscillospiraceae bacterium]